MPSLPARRFHAGSHCAVTDGYDTLPPTALVQRPRLGDNRASVQAAMVQAQYRRLAVPLLVSCSCCLLECWALWRGCLHA